MKIFLCWSGDRSRYVAEAFDKFLNDLNRALPELKDKPFIPFRSANIEKGLPWFEAVESELASAEAALVTITPENCESPWMHYEAGAIANGMRIEMSRKRNDETSADTLRGRLFTFLFGIDARDLKGPLAAYQSTAATHDDARALVRRLLTIAGVTLPTNEQDPVAVEWEIRFRLCWNDFVKRVRPCRHQRFCGVIADFERKFQRLTFQEPVARCHRQAWTDRIKGCHETLTDLQRRLGEVHERCRPYEAELYQQLLTALDGYEMTMQAYLVNDEPYKLGDEGKLKIPGDIEWVCEDRRHTVLNSVCDLLDPQKAPVFDESAAFGRMETFAEKKSAIHRKKSEIRRWLMERKEDASEVDLTLDKIKVAELDNAPALPDRAEFERASHSSWDFDKVIYYLTHAESLALGLREDVASEHGICTRAELQKSLPRWLNDEVESIRARQHVKQTIQHEQAGQVLVEAGAGASTSAPENDGAPTPSRIPLYYALGVLSELVKGLDNSRDWIRQVGAEKVEEYKSILRNIIELELGLESQVRTHAELILGKMQHSTADPVNLR